MCFQWHLHIISRPSLTWGNSLQLKAFLQLSCLTTDLPSMEKNLGSLPMTLTSCTPHHHPISINLMDSSRPWWKKVKNAYKKTDGSPNAQARALLQLHDTPITADLPSPPEILHGHPAQGTVLSRPSKRVNICQIRQRLVKLQEKQKEQFNSPQSQRSTYLQSQGTSAVLSQQTRHRPHQVGQLAQWLKYWNVDDPTWSRPPTAESTEGTELIWSPYVMMAPPFKTIQWKKGRNSPKTFPFKTIRPARPNPCPFRGKPSYMDTRSMLFDEPDTHQTPPTPPPFITPKALLTQITIMLTPSIISIQRVICGAQLRGLLTQRQEETPVWTSFHPTPWHWPRTLICNNILLC